MARLFCAKLENVNCEFARRLASHLIRCVAVLVAKDPPFVVFDFRLLNSSFAFEEACLWIVHKGSIVIFNTAMHQEVLKLQFYIQKIELQNMPILATNSTKLIISHFKCKNCICRVGYTFQKCEWSSMFIVLDLKNDKMTFQMHDCNLRKRISCYYYFHEMLREAKMWIHRMQIESVKIRN